MPTYAALGPVFPTDTKPDAPAVTLDYVRKATERLADTGIAQHLEQFPELHDVFWKAAKECSYAKVELSLHHAEALMGHIEKIHGIFWATKNRDVTYYTAS